MIEDAGLLNRLCRKFALMTSPFVIVHGGGTFAGQLAERLGIPRKMIDGRRVTDRETLEVTVMVYAYGGARIIVTSRGGACYFSDHA